MENCTGYQFAVFADERTFNLHASMLEPKPAPRNLRTFLLAELAIENAVCEHASTARLANGSALKRSDVALIDAGGFLLCGEVWCLCACNAVQMALVSVWEHVGMIDRRRGFDKWRKVSNPELWDLERILCVVTYRHYNNSVVVLIPERYRELLE